MSMAISPEAGRIGEIYAHLFENAEVGFERDIYWSITCPCAPIEFGGEKWQASITCEWLAWPFKNWKCLDGAAFELVKNSSLVECSFYLAQHHPVTLMALTLRAVPTPDRLIVEISGGVAIVGFDELDGVHAFAAEYEVEFEGLVVVPANLYPKPNNAREATAALAPFIQIADFHKEKWDRFRYLFSPVLSKKKQVLIAFPIP